MTDIDNEHIQEIISQYSREMKEADNQLKKIETSITKLQVSLQEMMIDYKNYQLKQQLILNTFLLNMRELGFYDIKLLNELDQSDLDLGSGEELEIDI